MKRARLGFGLSWVLGFLVNSQSVSQLFHGPTPRSPLHRLAVRLRHSRSNTSTEYSLVNSETSFGKPSVHTILRNTLHVHVQGCSQPRVYMYYSNLRREESGALRSYIPVRRLMKRCRVGDDGGGDDIIGDGDDGDVSVRSAEGEVVAWSRSAAARSAALANWVTLLGERHGRSPLLCRQLRSAACTLRDGEARVPAHAFGGDRSMRSIALPAGLTSLGEYALMWLLLDDVDRAARRPHESRWVRLLRLLLDDVDRAARQPHEPRYGRLLGLLLVDIDRAARRAPHEPRCVHLRWLLLNDIDRAARRL